MSITPAIAYFGYGSLVNLTTLRTPYISAHRARLRGWRRVWLSRPRDVEGFARLDGLAFLSVIRDTESEIDGIVIVDHATSLSALDKREVLYSRHLIDRFDCTFLDKPPLPNVELFLYAAEMVDLSQKPAEPRILRSYLDAVTQGFLNHFGERGLIDFRDTTDNFHFPILEDRKAPHYPRPVDLLETERSIIDVLFPGSHLDDCDVRSH